MACNVIKMYIDHNRKNFKNYTKIIMNNYFDRSLFDKYMDQYINVRYFNQEVWVRKDFALNIEYYLEKVCEKEPTDVSKFMLGLFKLYLYIDDVIPYNISKDASKFASLVNDVRKDKLHFNEQNFESKFSELIKSDYENNKRFISNFDTKDFSINVNKVDPDNVYNVVINHNVSIPKIYSGYAINKVWNDKMILENRIQIEYYLINQLLLKDVLNGNFDKKYLTGLSASLFSKPDKLKRTLSIFDNDIGKESIIIKVKYSFFLKNKETVLNYIKLGYQFAVVLDNVYIEKDSNKSIIDIFKYIIIDDDKYLVSDIKERKNVIYLK